MNKWICASFKFANKESSFLYKYFSYIEKGSIVKLYLQGIWIDKQMSTMWYLHWYQYYLNCWVHLRLFALLFYLCKWIDWELLCETMMVISLASLQHHHLIKWTCIAQKCKNIFVLLKYAFNNKCKFIINHNYNRWS